MSTYWNKTLVYFSVVNILVITCFLLTKWVNLKSTIYLIHQKKEPNKICDFLTSRRNSDCCEKEVCVPQFCNFVPTPSCTHKSTQRSDLRLHHANEHHFVIRSVSRWDHFPPRWFNKVPLNYVITYVDIFFLSSLILWTTFVIDQVTGLCTYY